MLRLLMLNLLRLHSGMKSIISVFELVNLLDRSDLNYESIITLSYQLLFPWQKATETTLKKYLAK